jgi:hypothetical protein
LVGSGKNVVLLCEGCGERIVLGGPVWVPIAIALVTAVCATYALLIATGTL